MHHSPAPEHHELVRHAPVYHAPEHHAPMLHAPEHFAPAHHDPEHHDDHGPYMMPPHGIPLNLHPHGEVIIGQDDQPHVIMEEGVPLDSLFLH